jgi:hypothetical protein
VLLCDVKSGLDVIRQKLVVSKVKQYVDYESPS